MYWLDGSSELQIYLSMTIVKATVRIWNPWGLCNKKWWKCLGLLLYKWKRKKILFWQIEAGFIRYTRRAKNILSNLDYFALSYWLLQIFIHTFYITIFMQDPLLTCRHTVLLKASKTPKKIEWEILSIHSTHSLLKSLNSESFFSLESFVFISLLPHYTFCHLLLKQSSHTNTIADRRLIQYTSSTITYKIIKSQR